MKKRAVLYVRVSTEDQAKYGFSLQAQKEFLIKYCAARGFEVVLIFTEDHSAKEGFDRPEYKRMRDFVADRKNRVDYLLVTQWSRFSRDSADAYGEIKRLSKINVEVNAVEQWIDFIVPESGFLLALYLAAPQVENVRLGLRTKVGMRQAMKLGRHVNKPPMGYKYERIDDKPILVPSDKADLITLAFNEVAKGIDSADTVRKHLKLNCSKNTFYNILRNVLYTGRIKIPAYAEEEEEIIKGIHTALVSIELFDEVQAILEGRKRLTHKVEKINQTFPLRGYLVCPECGRAWSASTSKNRIKNSYSYYHCQSKKCLRFSVEEVHSTFTSYLNSFKFPPECIESYQVIIKDVFKEMGASKAKEIAQKEEEIKGFELKIQNLEDKFVDGHIAPEEFKKIKKRFELNINELIGNKIDIEVSGDTYGQYVNYGISLINNLANYYEQSPVNVKQALVGSMFPEKLLFDGKSYRTPKLNSLLSLSASFSEGLQGAETKKADGHVGFSSLAP